MSGWVLWLAILFSALVGLNGSLPACYLFLLLTTGVLPLWLLLWLTGALDSGDSSQQRRLRQQVLPKRDSGGHP